MITIPPKLKTAYLDGSFGIFVGAGLSQGAGLPNWETLLLELISHAQENDMLSDAKEADLLKLVKDSSKYLLVAEELREVLNTDLQKFIKKRFDDDSIEPTEVTKKTIRLKSKFIITTNYDTLMENSYIKVHSKMPNVLTYRDAATINYNILSNIPFILKAHGDAKRAPNEIILTEKDYRNIIFKENGYQSVLHVLFSTSSILFLGASLKDPELNLVLSYIHNIFHGGGPSHFALINSNEVTSVEKDRWRKDYNINIITYDPHDNHKEVENLIDALILLDETRTL